MSNLNAVGIIARTGNGAYSARTLTGTANQITVTNGNGNAGNMTLSFPNTMNAPGNMGVVGAISVGGPGSSIFNGLTLDWYALHAPTVTTGNVALGALDAVLICNNATAVIGLTLGAPISGRTFIAKTYQAQNVVSLSANVIPITGGAAGTAILPGTAGAWAMLTYNVTNWEIIARG